MTATDTDIRNPEEELDDDALLGLGTDALDASTTGQGQFKFLGKLLHVSVTQGKFGKQLKFYYHKLGWYTRDGFTIAPPDARTFGWASVKMTDKGQYSLNSKAGKLLEHFAEVFGPCPVRELDGKIGWFEVRPLQFGNEKKAVESAEIPVPFGIPSALELSEVKHLLDDAHMLADDFSPGETIPGFAEEPALAVTEYSTADLEAVAKLYDGKTASQGRLAAMATEMRRELKQAVLDGDALPVVVEAGYLTMSGGAYQYVPQVRTEEMVL